LYHVHLVRFEAEGHTGDAVAYFRADLALTFGPLFRTRSADPLSPAGMAAAIAAPPFPPPPPGAPAPPPEGRPPPPPPARGRGRRSQLGRGLATPSTLTTTTPLTPCSSPARPP